MIGLVELPSRQQYQPYNPGIIGPFREQALLGKVCVHMQNFDASKPIRFSFFEFCDTSRLSLQMTSLIYPVHPMISGFFFGDLYMDARCSKV